MTTSLGLARSRPGDLPAKHRRGPDFGGVKARFTPAAALCGSFAAPGESHSGPFLGRKDSTRRGRIRPKGQPTPDSQNPLPGKARFVLFIVRVGDAEVPVSARVKRRSGLALIVGAVGLVMFWLGSRLFLNWGGIFGVGLLLALSTGLLIFGIVGLYSLRSPSLPYRALGLIGVLITAFGLVSRATIMLIGVAIFSLASIQAKVLPRVPLALVLVGALLLGLEEWYYGVLLAIRFNDPIPDGTPLAVVRWVVGLG